MTQHLIAYYSAEKLTAALLVLVAAAAFGFCSYLWKQKSPYRAMIYPLVAIGLLQLFVGVNVFVRTDAHVASLLQQLNVYPIDFRSEELARMEMALRNLTAYRVIELFVCAGGGVLLYVVRTNVHAKAIALGLAVQSAIMFVVHLLALWRTEKYVGRLLEFVPDLIVR